MLLDSNIIIYAARPEHGFLREMIAKHAPAVSAVSFVETLGYHRLQRAEQRFLQRFFDAAVILPIDRQVLEDAVRLRQQRRMTLGDALVAGTARVHGSTLVTRNVADFDWVDGLTVRDPFTQPIP